MKSKETFAGELRRREGDSGQGTGMGCCWRGVCEHADMRIYWDANDNNAEDTDERESLLERKAFAGYEKQGRGRGLRMGYIQESRQVGGALYARRYGHMDLDAMRFLDRSEAGYTVLIKLWPREAENGGGNSREGYNSEDFAVRFLEGVVDLSIYFL